MSPTQAEPAYRVIDVVRDVALTNELGQFKVAVVRTATVADATETDHLVVYRRLTHPLPLRIQSGCALGHIFGDAECDCKPQFRSALAYIRQHDSGMVIYTADHDGRGRGLLGKMKVYEHRLAYGVGSREACQALDLPYEARDFRQFATILGVFGVTSVCLLGLSAAKATGLRDGGIVVADQIAI